MNGNGEPLAHFLSRLPEAVPDERRAARVQDRCRTVLDRRTAPAPRPARLFESLCIVSLCLAYLIAVVQQALQ